ncbi:MAG: hypothetical protein ACKV2T_03985 [Kofleriaceae bacterium]
MLGFVACGEVKGGTDSGIGSFTLQVSPDDALVRQDTTIDLDVNVARTGLDADIVVTLANPPAGVTAVPLMLAGGATTGTLELQVAAIAAQGPITVEIVGTAGGMTSQESIDLLIGGNPGTLDQSFGGDGTVVPTLAGTSMVGRGVTIDSQGRVVVTGIVLSSPSQTLVVRVREDGTLDPDFGSGGIVSTGSGVVAQGFAVKTTDDAIFVAGVAGGASVNDNNFGLFRYTSAGVLDATFGVGGVVSFDPGVTSLPGEFRTLDIASDGSLLVVGHTFPMNDGVTTRGLRYSQLGVRDVTFNLTIAGNVYASAVQADGKLVLSGMRDAEILVGRYQPSGVPDSGFGAQGEVITNFYPDASDALGVAVLPDGKILAAAMVGGSVRFVRYNSNGSLDVTFGTGGWVMTTLSFDGSYAFDALVVSGGKLLYVGRSGDFPAVARFHLDGTPDTSFGTGGIAAIDFGVPGSSFGVAGFGLAVDADGRILVSAGLGDEPDQRLGVARLWP